MYDQMKTNYVEFFEGEIKRFGGMKRNTQRYILRKNVNNPFPNEGAYFGCINEGEEDAGPYSDLSIVIFPSNEESNENDLWIIALGVGSLGFKNDYDIASRPGTRRLFMKYLDNNSFIKNDFLDIESSDGFLSFCDNNNIPETLRSAVQKYGKVLLTATIFNPNLEEASKAIISKYLALYADFRGWPNQTQRREVERAREIRQPDINDEQNIRDLIEKRRFVVLQGAPGTGKTRLAKMISSKSGTVFFTQFHAETTYSDFVYGIIPDVNSHNLKYSAHEGVFVKAIKEAQRDKNKKAYLIIDEINRANLSNVLGPSFYLFEPNMADLNVEIEVCPELKLTKLPENFYVIATMNTADRSLAVVDFALRRRFAWYTVFPHRIDVDEGLYFCSDEFNEIADIFEKYASDEELNLQPGQAYFIVSNDNRDEINNRLRYEVMPLIKEYLLDGMLPRAKDDFVNYFRKKINEEMFR